jgi:hypothetical protein
MHIGIAAIGKKGFCDNNRKGMSMKTKRHIHDNTVYKHQIH